VLKDPLTCCGWVLEVEYEDSGLFVPVGWSFAGEESDYSAVVVEADATGSGFVAADEELSVGYAEGVSSYIRSVEIASAARTGNYALNVVVGVVPEDFFEETFLGVAGVRGSELLEAGEVMGWSAVEEEVGVGE